LLPGFVARPNRKSGNHLCSKHSQPSTGTRDEKYAIVPVSIRPVWLCDAQVQHQADQMPTIPMIVH
jgi:hypothetical protein